MVDAKEEGIDTIEVLGTGVASREFLYVEDAAEGILLATKLYEKNEPINLGSGKEISIKDLVSNIRDITGNKCKISWNRSKSDVRHENVWMFLKISVNLALKRKSLLKMD
jgi:GDP-L-fucose synthase